MRPFAGKWQELLAEARAQAVTRQPRRGLTLKEEARRRRAKACQQVRLGEVSRARQELPVAELAPGTEETLRELTHEELKPPRRKQPLNPEVLTSPFIAAVFLRCCKLGWRSSSHPTS